MTNNVSFKLAANEWVIKARWFYIAAIAVISLSLKWREVMSINWGSAEGYLFRPLFFVFILALLGNTLLYVVSRMIDLETAHKHIYWLSFLQIAVEIGLISLFLYDLPGWGIIISALYFIPIIESIVLFGHLGPLIVSILIGVIQNALAIFIYSGLLSVIIDQAGGRSSQIDVNTIFTWSLILSLSYLFVGSLSTYIAKLIGEREKALAQVSASQETQVKALELKNRQMEQDERSLKSKDYELETANQHLQELEEAKSKFVAVTAHQLRTPLSAIKWTFDMIMLGQLGPVTAEQKEFLGKGFDSTQRMIQIVNDLLHVDQMKTGQVEYQFASFDLSKLLDNVVSQFSNQAMSKEIKIVVTKPPSSSLPPIEGDESKLRIVLENLIDNAVKYTPKGGRVTVALSDKNINSASRTVDISITDSGIGIPAGDQSKIFGKFFRAGNAIRIEPDGSGIGLYISKDIIEKHGGSLSHENAPGGGTIFHLALPLKQQK